MRFSVSVPVLSVQMYVTDPSVSTAGSFRINACWRTSFRAPNASEIVTTAGNASGIAATASEMAVSSISIAGSPRSSPETNTTPEIASTAHASRWPNTARRRCRGVRPSS